MNEEVGNPLPAGAQLKEQYQVEEILGIGGFGITYLARDAVLDYKIAVKEYFPWELAFRKPDHSVSPRAPVTEQYFNWGLANFLKEARTLARFNHPNIVRVYNFFETNNTAYMVMEYEEGENLGSCLARKGALDEAAVRKILFPILDGLEALHAKNVIHRDIKPSNIFLRTAGIPLLLDFGNARNLDASRDLTVVVSPRYSPPEQFDTQERQGPWTDIYALGVVLYTMVSGYSPVDTSQRIGAVRRNRPDPLTPASEVGKGRYSAPFLRAIDWAMSFERHNRPQSIREWRLQLERVPDGPGAHGSEPAEKGGTDSQSKPVEEKRRNRGWLRGFFRRQLTIDPILPRSIQIHPDFQVEAATIPEYGESRASRVASAKSGEEDAGEPEAIIASSTGLPLAKGTQPLSRTETLRDSVQTRNGALAIEMLKPADSAETRDEGSESAATEAIEGVSADLRSASQGHSAPEANRGAGILESCASFRAAGSNGPQAPGVFDAHRSNGRHRAPGDPLRRTKPVGGSETASSPELESNRAVGLWSPRFRSPASSLPLANTSDGGDLDVFDARRRTNRYQAAGDVFSGYQGSTATASEEIAFTQASDPEARIEVSREKDTGATAVALAEAADHIRRGNTLNWQGREKEALEEWEKASALVPEDKDLRLKIDRLERALAESATIPNPEARAQDNNGMG